MTAETVDQALKHGELPDDVRTILEIRRSLARSSVAKYDALKRSAGPDNRVRGTTMYHGAGTGRWAGKIFQPHNLPRGTFTDYDIAIELMIAGHLADIDMYYGDPMEVAATLIRPMVAAEPDKILMAADYSSIEARGIAWLAGDEHLLNIFRGEGLIYETAASDVFGVPIDQVTKEQRQIGKVVILACGYQGWVGAFQSMASTYGVYVDDDRAAEIVGAWRNKNQKIVKLWYGLEEAAMFAVKRPGVLGEFKGIKFQVRDKFLVCRLPSGRCLYYRRPGLRTKVIPSGREKEVITYHGIDSNTSQWIRIDTYGGKLTENIIQAICRDVLASAITALENTGRYPVVLHVHDEIVCEVPEEAVAKGDSTLEEMQMIMELPLDWSDGFPIKAEGWQGRRFRK